ncbi:MAG TPA: ATP-binding protein [Thermoplasmata archaeon]|nr:ATP-binding protein [Thermoplasmata archaeon]
MRTEGSLDANRTLEILDEVPVGLALVDPRGRITWANRAATRILKLTSVPKQLVPNLEAAPEGGLAAEVRAVRETLVPRSLHGVEKGSIAADGNRELLDVEIVPLEDPNRGVTHTLLVLTEWNANETRMESSSLFYQAFLRSHEAIEVTDQQGTYVDVNPAFEQIYGYRRRDVLGKNPRLLRSPKTPPETFRALWNDILDPANGHWTGELVNLDQQGHEHTVLLTVDAIRGGDGEISHFVGVATDLSQVRSLEQAAIRTERLASLGQLAAGVAHELNTPLANIMLIAESLQRRAPSAWVTTRAQSIATQVDSAAKIVGGLLDFARSHPTELAEVDVVDVAIEAVRFVKGKQLPDLTIHQVHRIRPLPVRANRVQLLQVCVNLLNNAFDAMDGRGTLTLKSRPVDGWVELAFQDTGPGIEPAVLPHLFEPFYTTKPVGRGTGLGLSICHGIVQAHGGEIRVETKLGRGTTFTVRLPSTSK